MARAREPYMIDLREEKIKTAIQDGVDAFCVELDRHGILRDARKLGITVPSMVEKRGETSALMETKMFLIALFVSLRECDFWYVVRYHLPHEMAVSIFNKCVNTRQVTLRHLPTAGRLATAYCLTKQKIDNCRFGINDLKNLLRNLRSRVYSTVNSQLYIDVYVVTLALTVQSLNGFFTQKAYLRMMWTDVRGRSAQGIDMTLALVVYNGYRAYFASKHPERANQAQSYLWNIASVVDLVASPFLRLVSYMFHHYSYRWLCSSRARSRNDTDNAADVEKESAIQMFDLAVMGVKSEFGTNEQLQQFVNGWCLVNKILCYLMITNNFVVKTDQGIKTTSMALSRKYIDVLKRNLSDLTLRQKVKYCLCQARICEYEKDMDSASSYMREVITLVTEGAFCKEDIDNIHKYHDYVLRLSLSVPNTGTC